MSLEVEVEHELGPFSIDARFTSEGRLTALFGRSGSGKTTLVNIIGGLIRPRRGRVVVDSAVLLDSAARIFVPKHRRRVGYVFQEGRLFPHLTVHQNLLFGRWFNHAPPDRDGRAEHAAVVELLGIGHLLQRRPAALSGGEQQRVAIGRALLCRPRVLLMDEPLASLDEGRKVEILPYLERVRDEWRVPIVYVSHSVAEVARLATTLVVLEAGRISAVGPAIEVMARLDIGPLAGDPDGGSILEATVLRHDAEFGLTVLGTRAGELILPRLERPVGASTRALVRARDVMLCLEPPRSISALNLLPGTITEVGEPTFAWCEVRLRCGNDAQLLVRVTRKSVVDLDLAPGRRVFAVIKSVALVDSSP